MMEKKLYTSRMTKRQLQQIIDNLQDVLRARENEIAVLKGEKPDEEKESFDFSFDPVLAPCAEPVEFTIRPTTEEERELAECASARRRALMEIASSDPELQGIEELVSAVDVQNDPAWQAEWNRRYGNGRRRRGRHRGGIRAWFQSLRGKINSAPNYDDEGNLISHAA